MTSMIGQVVVWWLVIQALGLAGLPLTLGFFRWLPDRGYAFSKSLGLLLTGYGAWLLAMFGLASFGVPLLVLVALLVAGVGVWSRLNDDARRRGGDEATPPLPSSPLRLFARVTSWRLILGYEVLFLVALVFVAWLRAHNPDPWGTERPMDYAFFNAIRQSTSFPPQDPWLAGYSINYYYFGYLLMAVVGRLSGIDPAAAYNLALALTFALTALGVAGLLANLLALTPVARTRLPRVAPLVLLLGVTMVLVVGNQAGALQVIVGNERVVALDGPQLLAALGQAAQGREVIDLPHPVNAADFGAFRTLERRDRLTDFNWWWPSRALWDDYTAHGRARQYTITEFPFFSFWLGDMHPHVLALPGGVLALALVLATLVRPPFPTFAHGRHGWVELVLTGIILGSLSVINSWDLPAYVLLYAGALLVTHARVGALARSRADAGEPARGGVEERTAQGAQRPADRDLLCAVRFDRFALREGGMVLVALFGLFLPFHLTFQAPVGAAAPWIHLPVVGRLSQIIGPVTGVKSGVHAFLIIFGLFFIPLSTFVYLATGAHARGDAGDNVEKRGESSEQRARRSIATLTPHSAPRTAGWAVHSPLAPPSTEGRRVVASSPRPIVASSPRPIVASSPRRLFSLRVTASALPRFLASVLHWWLPLILLLLGLLLGFPLLALAGVGALAFRQALRMPERPAETFVLLVITLGCAICVGTELIYIRDVFEGLSPRMNTIFKFYYQVWLLWGTVTAYALWWLVTQTGHTRRVVALVISGVSLLLLLGGLVYPAITLRDTWTHGTLVGLNGKTPRETTAAGQASIRWLRTHVAPGSVVLEMVDPQGGSYNGVGFGGVSASTGLPTVLGWVGHQHQWRGGDAAARAEIEPRKTDVDRIYRTRDLAEARELLERYTVAYVYIGALERQHYDPDSLAKFAHLGRVVWAMDEVTIYDVRMQ